MAFLYSKYLINKKVRCWANIQQYYSWHNRVPHFWKYVTVSVYVLRFRYCCRERKRIKTFAKSERVKRVPSRKGGTGSMLVEAARIELASENSSIQLSTSVFYLLKFPWQTAGKRAGCQSSPYTIQGHGHSPVSFTTNRCPSGSRGTHPVDRSWLKQLPVRYF